MSDSKLVEKSDIQLVTVDYQVKINNINEQFKNLINNERLESVLVEVADQLLKKVDKEDGKSLVATEDIEQITKNKKDISAINEVLAGVKEFLEENI